MGLIAAFVLGCTLLCLLAIIGRNRVLHRHRVDPATPTDAPLSWLVDPRAPARLHRRLARVGTATTAVAHDHRPPGRRLRKVPSPSPLANTAQELRAQAVALDLQLARLAVLGPRARREPLMELGAAVSRAEEASARLMAISAHARAPRGLDTDPGALREVTDRIDRLAEAHQELLELDARNRLQGNPVGAPPLSRRLAVDPAAIASTGRTTPTAPLAPAPAPPTRAEQLPQAAPPPTSAPPPPPVPQTWPPTPGS